MTHLHYLETLQFTVGIKECYTGVLKAMLLLFNFEFMCFAKIKLLFTGRIIWPNSLSLVNVTNFPQEQHPVLSVLGPKRGQNE